MNATPRVRSGAFPQSPATVRAGRGAPPTPSPSPPAEARDRAYAGPRPLFASARPPRSAIPGIDGVSRSAAATAAAPPPARPGPLISVDLLDAPTQRLYVLAIYAVLLSWKIYDWVQLIEDNAESFWIFAKWIGIDFAFLFGLPELRIPWLELSQPAAIVFFLGHVAMNYMLMFNVGLPLHAWVLAIAKVFYDRELSISEHYVKTSSILHNASLISGRQIINILPEGSAVLNPDSLPFCISGGSNNAWGPTTAVLPLYFNATVPAEVELIRIDLDTNEEETLRLTKSQLRDIAKLVKRQEAAATDDDTPTAAVRFDVPVKKTGAYRLGRVLDEYKLDVQRSSPLSFVVACPAARVRSSGQTKPLLWSQGTPGPVMRCHGDLSNLWVEVDGTPPLKIVYSRTINGKDHSFHFQSLQPEGFVSPLLGTRPVRMPGSAALTNHDATDAAAAADALDLPSEEYADISWARSRSVPVGFNESMLVGGEWKYSIDEVHDAFGNVIKYNDPAAEDADQGHPRASSAKHLVQSFLVRDRPRIRFKGCDLREPLKVAQGRFAALPIHYDMPGQRDPHERSTHTVTYQFSPLDSLTNSGDHGDVVSTEIFQARFVGSQPWLSEPGLYTLKSVSADSCEGAVLEPAACLLLNPPKPTLSLRAESIPDSCGNSNIGMRVHLDLVGTPPFIVRYEINSDGGKWTHERVHISDMQYEMQLTPPSSGNHKYIFRSIGDAVYVDEPLSRGPEMTLEQTVKAPPSAGIVDGGDKVVCLEEAVEADVALGGDPPFTLEYALIRDGSRQPFKAEHITGNRVHIATPVLSEGGEYLLTLTSILDSSGCRTMLKGDKSEMRISVRRQPPRAAFGLLEGRRRVLAVEDAEVLLPLRLTGGEPWEITYRKLDDGGRAAAGDEVKKQLWSGNGAIGVSKRGTYEITSVRDSKCPGVVDASASTFEVDWFPRPQMSFVPTDGIREQDGNVFVKKDVCEGDVDGFEIDLKGSPPYHVEYDVRHKPDKGQSSLIHKQLDAALGRISIQMDTSKAGTYRYEFAPPADSLYNNVPRAGFQKAGGRGGAAAGTGAAAPLVLQQTVFAEPTAVFSKAGQSFKYCTIEQDNEERIPMVLTGVAPFIVEIEIKHQSVAAPETYRVPSITTHTYGLQIPRQYLRPGTQQVRIRKVRDARGCQQKTDDLVLGSAGAGGKSAAAGGGAGGSAASVQVQLFEAPAIYAMESRTDYCVGERISYTLSGASPFDVWYTFGGVARKATSATTAFRRVAEAPGEFAITAISDRAAPQCRAAVQHLVRTIHPLPSVRVSKGRTARVDIHEGGTVEMVLEFGGTPPFEFSYTRSSNARKGQRSSVLETRHDVSHEMTKVVQVSQEGTYEVIAIKDAFCAFSTLRGAEGSAGGDTGTL